MKIRRERPFHFNYGAPSKPSEDSYQPIQRTTILALVGITLLALGLRLGHLWAVADTAFLSYPIHASWSDMYSFWQWSQHIRAGDWLGWDTYHPHVEWMDEFASRETWYQWWGGKERFHQAPLYPYFIAVLRSLQDSLLFILGFQMVIGALHPLIMFSLARRLTRSNHAGLFAAGMTAAYGPFIFYQGVILRDGILPILETLTLVFLIRAMDQHRLSQWVLTGGLLGASLLTKETAVALLGLTAIWLVLSRRWGLRFGKPFLSVALGLCLVLAPLVIRNLYVGAPPWALSIRSAGILLTSLHPGNPAVGFTPHMVTAGTSIMERTGGELLLTMLELLRIYREDPWALLRHEFAKLRALADVVEVPNNVSICYGLDLSPVLAWTFGYGLIFPLGLAGLALAWRRPWDFLPLHLYAFFAFVVQLFPFVLARFRLELAPVLILGGALIGHQVYEYVRTKRLWQATATLYGILVISLVQQFMVPTEGTPPLVRFTDSATAAKVYAAEHQFDRAVAELGRFRERACKKSTPGQVTALAATLEGDYRCQWAEFLLRQDDQEEGRQQLAAAESLYVQQDTFAYPLYNLGVLFLRVGDRVRARDYLLKYLEAADDEHLANKARAFLDRLGSSAN